MGERTEKRGKDGEKGKVQKKIRNKGKWEKRDEWRIIKESQKAV